MAQVPSLPDVAPPGEQSLPLSAGDPQVPECWEPDRGVHAGQALAGARGHRGRAPPGDQSILAAGFAERSPWATAATACRCPGADLGRQCRHDAGGSSGSTRTAASVLPPTRCGWIRAAIQEYILQQLVAWSRWAPPGGAGRSCFFNLRKVKGQLQAIEDGDLPPETVTEIADPSSTCSEQDVINMNRRLASPDHFAQCSPAGQ